MHPRTKFHQNRLMRSWATDESTNAIGQFSEIDGYIYLYSAYKSKESLGASEATAPKCINFWQDI